MTPVSFQSKVDVSRGIEANAWKQVLCYFIMTVLGFSFWFFIVVPFASHRETYSWLAEASTQTLAQQFSFGLSSTYRPLSQVVTWLGFQILNPHIFPTSVLRQTLLQGFIYVTFVLAWWLIYSAAAHRRTFAVVAFVAGCVFFSGYVQLFHIYGIFYVAVMLTLGALLRFYASASFGKREVWFGAIAILLVFWHPYSTALFVGFFFGFYLDTFEQRSKEQHAQAAIILLVAITAIFSLVVLFPRTPMPLHTRLVGFLVSYRTNEVNGIASFAAYLLTQLAILSTAASPKAKVAAFLLASALSVAFLFTGLPLLLLWPCAALAKLLSLRNWSLFFLMLTAALLPLGGGIGTPIYVLFAIIVSTYVTALGWSEVEKALYFLEPRYALAMAIGAAIVITMVRAGITVPIVTRFATPLLAERERTYQLEGILAWLHNSEYCGYKVAFVDDAGNPIDDIESAMTRRNRPPAGLEDVQLFWNAILQCQAGHSDEKAEAAIVTFGGQAVTDSSPVFTLRGRYAGDATVWIGLRQRIASSPYQNPEGTSSR